MEENKEKGEEERSQVCGECGYEHLVVRIEGDGTKTVYCPQCVERKTKPKVPKV